MVSVLPLVCVLRGFAEPHYQAFFRPKYLFWSPCRGSLHKPTCNRDRKRSCLREKYRQRRCGALASICVRTPAQTRFTECRRLHQTRHVPCTAAQTCQNNQRHGYALSLLRPLALRRRNTFCPSAVFILLRKPCTLLRCRFLG